MAHDERRIHARIETELNCTIMTPDGAIEGTVRDLSRGGAMVESADGLAEIGDTLELEIDVPGVDYPIAVMGEVVRREGPFRYGLRFSLVEPKQRDELVGFISRIAEGRGVGRRESPRIYRRVEVVCRTEAQTCAVMSNISEGGMALTCDIPLVLDEEVTVEVVIEGFADHLELTGHVIHVRRVGEGSYYAGLQFDPLPEARRQAVVDLIQFLLKHERPEF